MKIYSAVVTICFTLIAACNPGAAQPNPTVTIPSLIPATQTTIPATATRLATATLASTPTPLATATMPATATRPAKATLPPDSKTPPSSAQGDLKDEWRSVFNGSQILFSSCELMYETHIRYQGGEIDITKAKSDLAIESNTFSIVQREFVKWLEPSAAVLPYKGKLERDMGTIIELWEVMNSSDIGTPSVTDRLFNTCSSLSATQINIVNTAMKAGLTGDSADELASEIEELLNDLYNTVRG